MRRRDGFTLIETLAASLIVCLLMVCVLHVVSGLARTQQAMARPGDRDSGNAAVDLLAWDLRNAIGVQPSDTALILRGHCGLDPVTREPSLRPVQVVYRIATGGWLVRDQTDSTGGRQWTELVSGGVSKLSVKPIGMATGYRVVVWWNDARRPLVDRTLLLR